MNDDREDRARTLVNIEGSILDVIVTKKERGRRRADTAVAKPAA